MGQVPPLEFCQCRLPGPECECSPESRVLFGSWHPGDYFTCVFAQCCPSLFYGVNSTHFKVLFKRLELLEKLQLGRAARAGCPPVISGCILDESPFPDIL